MVQEKKEQAKKPKSGKSMHFQPDLYFENMIDVEYSLARITQISSWKCSDHIKQLKFLTLGILTLGVNNDWI